MISRDRYRNLIQKALSRNIIVGLLGARQVGKTTLAREFVDKDSVNYFDLEDPTVANIMENPMTALQSLKGLVVIDEAQRQPNLFPVLRVLADRDDQPAQFLILGSASPELSRQASESLAGRIEIIQMSGFSLSETGSDNLDKLWMRGGFPRSYLATNNENSIQWRSEFIRTFLERDLAGLGFGMSPVAMRRFWTMIAHYNGQILNQAEIASSLGVVPNTIRNYMDALEQTFMIRQLHPWFANVKKRLVKRPKLYFRDSGLFHALIGIEDERDLMRHPKLGVSWENFALDQVLQFLNPNEAYFYGVHSGTELDLFIPQGSKLLGVEFKRQDAPKITKSMHNAITDLGLTHLWIVYPGSREYSLNDIITVKPLKFFVEG
ncbi:MAG: putative AAA+ superfamily ATPase [Lentimonas sp.]|jgi:predicted AAA+ superfamily ATPase